MPIPLAALTADRRTLRIPFGDDQLTITYTPSAVNAVQEARELAEREQGRHLLAQARSLAESIISWDVVDEHGETLPVTEEVLCALGLAITSKLTRAITEYLVPNRLPRADSRNGSSPTDGSERRLTGTPS